MWRLVASTVIDTSSVLTILHQARRFVYSGKSLHTRKLSSFVLFFCLIVIYDKCSSDAYFFFARLAFCSLFVTSQCACQGFGRQSDNYPCVLEEYFVCRLRSLNPALGGMIDFVELLVGTLGLASSIYDPWIGDERASILVTYTRTASVCTFFGLAIAALVTLIPSGVLEVDPTTLAVVFFAVGGSAPTLARGAWSLIDMSTMFNDVLLLSYPDHEARFDPGTFGVFDFVAWFVVVFRTLMKHNVSVEKLNPYGPDLYRAFRNNWESFVHGRSVHPKKICWKHAWNFGWSGWATRVKALFGLVVLDGAGFAFLLLQICAAVGEGLLLSVGGAWLSLAIAAQAKGLTKTGLVNRELALKIVVEELICCQTCSHTSGSQACSRTDDGQACSHADDTPMCTHANNSMDERENTKSFGVLMPKVIAKSRADRCGSSDQDINVCRCRVCTFGCRKGWQPPAPCHDCVNNASRRSSEYERMH